MNIKSYQLQRLTDEEQKDPLGFLKDFFEEFTLIDIRETLRNYLYLTLTNPTEQEPQELGNAMYMAEKLEALAEAAYLLRKKK